MENLCWGSSRVTERIEGSASSATIDGSGTEAAKERGAMKWSIVTPVMRSAVVRPLWRKEGDGEDEDVAENEEGVESSFMCRMTSTKDGEFEVWGSSEGRGTLSGKDRMHLRVVHVGDFLTTLSTSGRELARLIAAARSKKTITLMPLPQKRSSPSSMHRNIFWVGEGRRVTALGAILRKRSLLEVRTARRAGCGVFAVLLRNWNSV